MDNQQLLQKAMETFPNETGTVEQWIAQHPQRDQPVDIVTAFHKDNVSIVSWNLMSHTLFTRRINGAYSYVDQNLHSWPNRLDKIVDHLHVINADIICLQEVDLDCFHELSSRLSMWTGSIQKRKDAEDFACCIFWRKPVQCTEINNRISRGLIVAFENKLVVANVHLHAHGDAYVTRARQINSVLNKVKHSFPNHRLILTGDFNDEAHSNLHGVLRNNVWHTFDLVSAYEHPSTYDCGATFMMPGRRTKIDHVFYTHKTLQLEQVFNFQLKEREDGPNQNCPSDHVPVGASFSWKPMEIPQEIDKQRKEQLTSLFEQVRTPPHHGKPDPQTLVVLQDAAKQMKLWMSTLDTLEKEFVQCLKRSSK